VSLVARHLAGWLLLTAWVLATATVCGQEGKAQLPRRERIIFCSDRAGTWRIWACDPDGSELLQLTSGSAEDGDYDPMAAPDGRTILFTSTRQGRTGIWRMNGDGTGLEYVCDGDQAEWSPDGKQICFRRNESIWTRDLALKTEKRLTDDAWPHCSGPAWSPDGTKIAFACRWDGANAVFVMAAGGGVPVRLYGQEGACEPHWSPDGSLIVYETETHLCTIEPDGTGNRPITWFGGVQRYGRFSPDGRHVVFCQGMSEHGPWELYVVPAPGGTPRRLTEEGSDLHPHWHEEPLQ
jgi:Tol biopolymer transport system component